MVPCTESGTLSRTLTFLCTNIAGAVCRERPRRAPSEAERAVAGRQFPARFEVETFLATVNGTMLLVFVP